MKLKDQRILVTGGTRGIGRAIVERALTEGAAHMVVISEETTPHDWAVLEESGRATFVQANMGTEDEPGAAVWKAHEIMGGIEGAVHCAGVYPEGNPGQKSEAQLWNESVNIKARGGYLLAAEFVKLATVGASFVAVTSINAEQSEPDHRAYDPACAALGGVVRAFAVHHAPDYRFNALAPGLIRTRLTEEVHTNPEVHAHVCANIPMRRLGSAEDCAGAAIFLLSHDSTYITGDTLFVDGGIRANQMSFPESSQ